MVILGETASIIFTMVFFTVIILRALNFAIFIVVIMLTRILKVRGSAILSSFPLPLIADRSADLAKSFGVLQPAQRYYRIVHVSKI